MIADFKPTKVEIANENTQFYCMTLVFELVFCIDNFCNIARSKCLKKCSCWCFSGDVQKFDIDEEVRCESPFQKDDYPDSKIHEANMGPTWGRQDPEGPHVGPMNLFIWVQFH